ncbi:MAG: gliding motility lipoprotein GldH [Bacteroidetes bacterium]|nr:gliding motility lipoprotein GldH [Bacteroidota bacterium]MBS1540007.1 gliding motility lipoprotein GldH [Bacteroidota bacterium]
MKFLFVAVGVSILLAGCDSKRLFEKNTEFKERIWKINDPVEFDFQIADTVKKYNLLVNVRNSLDYPYARLFFNYELLSPDHTSIDKKLMSEYLFDQKTGKPYGTSGLGDVYDHQFSLLQNYSFKKAGAYHLKVEQFMRLDSLPGIMAVGLRVERAKE